MTLLFQAARMLVFGHTCHRKGGWLCGLQRWSHGARKQGMGKEGVRLHLTANCTLR